MSNKPEYPRIILSNHETWDFSSWFQEKSDALLHNLSRASTCLDKIENGEHEERYDYNEQLRDNLDAATRYAVALMSIIYGCETQSEADDYLLIASKGFEGYKELMDKYGMPLPETIKKKEDEKIREEMHSHINGNRTNRTIIHELLQKITSKNTMDMLIADDIEKVTMNELSWDEFVRRYKIDK